jgi:hypothetical protein
MSKKRNAGQRAARANMAYKHRDANELVQIADFNKKLDDFFDTRVKGMREAAGALLDDLGFSKVAPSKEVFGSLNPLFGVQILDPMRLAGISSIETGRTRSTEERTVGKPAAFGKPYGVPPLFAPRDNGHRQSADDLEVLEVLISESKYTIPISLRDRFGRPDWGSDVELVDGRHPDAGEWGKLCYRTACQKPYAFFYNFGTCRHYCQTCADSIDRENMAGMKLHHLARYEGAPA